MSISIFVSFHWSIQDTGTTLDFGHSTSNSFVQKDDEKYDSHAITAGR